MRDSYLFIFRQGETKRLFRYGDAIDVESREVTKAPLALDRACDADDDTAGDG